MKNALSVILYTVIGLCSGFAAAFVPSTVRSSRDLQQQQQQKQQVGTLLEASSSKQSWDALRFIRQSSRFVDLPFLPRSATLTLNDVRPGDILWETPNAAKNLFTMAPLDDVVMGGVSSSTFDSQEGRWTGVVTDANNGGFVGIRSTPSFKWNMEQCKGLQWTLNQNSKAKRRFKFVLRDSAEFNGITWTTSVDLKPGRNVVKIDFRKQVPALFAKTIPDQIFKKDNVVGVQIAYSKFEYDGDLNPNFELGPVDLQLLELKAF